MFVETPGGCDAKQHRSIVRGTVRMRTRGKVCHYIAGRNYQSGKPSVIYEDKQGMIFLANNSQVDICTKHIDICHNFLRGMVEEKYIYIQYIQSEENPSGIMTKNTSEADFARNIRSITKG